MSRSQERDPWRKLASVACRSPRTRVVWDLLQLALVPRAGPLPAHSQSEIILSDVMEQWSDCQNNALPHFDFIGLDVSRACARGRGADAPIAPRGCTLRRADRVRTLKGEEEWSCFLCCCLLVPSISRDVVDMCTCTVPVGHVTENKNQTGHPKDPNFAWSHVRIDRQGCSLRHVLKPASRHFQNDTAGSWAGPWHCQTFQAKSAAPCQCSKFQRERSVLHDSLVRRDHGRSRRVGTPY